MSDANRIEEMLNIRKLRKDEKVSVETNQIKIRRPKVDSNT